MRFCGRGGGGDVVFEGGSPGGVGDLGRGVAVSLERFEEDIEVELGVGGYVEDCDGLLMWRVKGG